MKPMNCSRNRLAVCLFAFIAATMLFTTIHSPVWAADEFKVGFSMSAPQEMLVGHTVTIRPASISKQAAVCQDIFCRVGFRGGRRYPRADQFCAKRHKIIFATAAGYLDITREVARKFPDTVFMNIAAWDSDEKNVGQYYGRLHEGRYLTGVVAGKMTKSNIIGFVAAHPIPGVIFAINGFALGAEIRESRRQDQSGLDQHLVQSQRRETGGFKPCRCWRRCHCAAPGHPQPAYRELQSAANSASDPSLI